MNYNLIVQSFLIDHFTSPVEAKQWVSGALVKLQKQNINDDLFQDLYNRCVNQEKENAEPLTKRSKRSYSNLPVVVNEALNSYTIAQTLNANQNLPSVDDNHFFLMSNQGTMFPLKGPYADSTDSSGLWDNASLEAIAKFDEGDKSVITEKNVFSILHIAKKIRNHRLISACLTFIRNYTRLCEDGPKLIQFLNRCSENQRKYHLKKMTTHLSIVPPFQLTWSNRPVITWTNPQAQFTPKFVKILENFSEIDLIIDANQPYDHMDLIEYATRNPMIRSLKLSGITFTKSETDLLVRMLIRNTTLNELDLTECVCTKELFSLLPIALLQNKTLVTFRYNVQDYPNTEHLSNKHALLIETRKRTFLTKFKQHVDTVLNLCSDIPPTFQKLKSEIDKISETDLILKSRDLLSTFIRDVPLEALRKSKELFSFYTYYYHYFPENLEYIALLCGEEKDGNVSKYDVVDVDRKIAEVNSLLFTPSKVSHNQIPKEEIVTVGGQTIKLVPAPFIALDKATNKRLSKTEPAFYIENAELKHVNLLVRGMNNQVWEPMELKDCLALYELAHTWLVLNVLNPCRKAILENIPALTNPEDINLVWNWLQKNHDPQIARVFIAAHKPSLR